MPWILIWGLFGDWFECVYCILWTVVCVDRALFVGICLVNDSLKFIESNSWIYFNIVLNKNWKIYWSEQSFNGLGPEEPLLIVRTVFFFSLLSNIFSSRFFWLFTLLQYQLLYSFFSYHMVSIWKYIQQKFLLHNVESKQKTSKRKFKSVNNQKNLEEKIFDER
jgi:hypothetical protein